MHSPQARNPLPDTANMDAVIIGGGPAGLTAATYLGRFHRKAIVIDGGKSRARWIPESHNIPGFPQGIVGVDFLQQLHAQALRFGAKILQDAAVSIATEDDHFLVHTSGRTLSSSYVVLATGINDTLPKLTGSEEAVLRSLVRLCPICDGFEATGHNIAIIGDGEHGQREAEFLRSYSDRVTLVHVGQSLDAEARQHLLEQGIALIQTPLDTLELMNNSLMVLEIGKEPRAFDICYAALGCQPQNQLAAQLGAERDSVGALVVNSHQETSVPGLYAAGDVVRGLNQVVVAAAEAAIAATDIHNKLRRAQRLAMPRPAALFDSPTG
jgi:thioredoxin reductase (NADPH)